MALLKVRWRRPLRLDREDQFHAVRLVSRRCCHLDLDYANRSTFSVVRRSVSRVRFALCKFFLYALGSLSRSWRCSVGLPLMPLSTLAYLTEQGLTVSHKTEKSIVGHYLPSYGSPIWTFTPKLHPNRGYSPLKSGIRFFLTSLGKSTLQNPSRMNFQIDSSITLKTPTLPAIFVYVFSRSVDTGTMSPAPPLSRILVCLPHTLSRISIVFQKRYRDRRSINRATLAVGTPDDLI
jgi:hypothetical protein